MLPDFPKIKQSLFARAAAYVEHLVRQEPLLRDIPRVHHFEGADMLTELATRSAQRGGYEHFRSANIEVDTDAIIDKGPVAFFERLQLVAEDLKAHQVHTLLARAGEAADSVGNTIHTRGRPLAQSCSFKC